MTGGLIRSGQWMPPVLNLECGHDSKNGWVVQISLPPRPKSNVEEFDCGGDGIEAEVKGGRNS